MTTVTVKILGRLPSDQAAALARAIAAASPAARAIIPAGGPRFADYGFDPAHADPVKTPEIEADDRLVIERETVRAIIGANDNGVWSLLVQHRDGYLIEFSPERMVIAAEPPEGVSDQEAAWLRWKHTNTPTANAMGMQRWNRMQRRRAAGQQHCPVCETPITPDRLKAGLRKFLSKLESEERQHETRD